ncbi:alpha-glucosidase [Pelagimonas varians]|uniref:Oligo-1,6-glucosidase n=1 Tax=Pelagimonas varians TaxID=696760 RepID=A0A238L0M1_9RHOB|nr:alpha-glucosidase [Pelagimonas varians]PYG27604.1 alpha-glucosidase [Pelagimonas varians]SMX47876.1 Oligo-1,6-glucosidase [Pelagimonas varians]
MNTHSQINISPLVADKDWWRGAVIYQIYPRSYQDSTGDGIGDLPGITRRLPHIASLGVDAIWISPFFKSPMKDFGYDVSDYCDVDPMFGTLDDFDTLIARAHELGLRVMIDQVLSHSSDQHDWFKESRSSRDNPKADWYVWADPNPDGTPPNNWLSIFGGSAWQWDTRREQYFMHNFLTSQPDLNFHCADVQDALLDSVRFWLDRGVDGFRLDTINFYIHDKQLRSNPALAPEDRDDSIAPRVNPYNHQLHLYSKNQPENIAFLERFRALLDEYPAAAAVGEVGDAQRGLEIMGEYTAGDNRVHMCYSFEFLSGDTPSAARVVDVLTKVDEAAPDGWACWAFSNHDVVRHASRWSLDGAAQRAFATLLMCLRGSACLYQGEELGLEEAEVGFDDLQDPYGIEFWPEFKGRDGCRTPMVWEQSNSFGGFSDAKPWLPVAPEHLSQSVTAQEQDPSALLHHYRRAVALRHAERALAKGELTGLRAFGDVVEFQRTDGDDVIYCAFNLSNGAAPAVLPGGDWEAIGDELSCTLPQSGSYELGPWQVALARRIKT